MVKKAIGKKGGKRHLVVSALHVGSQHAHMIKPAANKYQGAESNETDRWMENGKVQCSQSANNAMHLLTSRFHLHVKRQVEKGKRRERDPIC